jgi:radical SAM protein with 4Fe4S-binding SPASM domain
MDNVLTHEQIETYNQKRRDFDKSRDINTISPCVAPYNNMYFTTEGNVAPCWLLVGHLEKWGPNRSIRDIWFGEHFTQYRENLKNGVFNSECRVCKQKIEADTWPLAMAYDGFPVREYPSCLELELSNQCNLECVMCEGRLSSGIRKNRDKLPPLSNVYDDSFVEQLKEFIPHLEELRFNGGEPFAQKIVYDICMLVADLKPSLRINIATNGTVYNKQVRTILDRCNVHLNISIDSLDKQNYESIRINGDFDVLMENFKIFNQYCKDNDRGLSVMVNPMRNNWWEMSKFVEFTIENKVHLWYNTIHHPEHLGIWNLPSTELANILETLTPIVHRLKPIDHSNYVAQGNWEKFEHFVNKQITNWYNKQLTREQEALKNIIPIIHANSYRGTL